MNIEDIDIYFNYHTHTKRCGHAGYDDDEKYVEEAIKAGIKILGFSDHCPFKGFHQKGVRMDYEEFDDYLNSIERLQSKYEGKCEIIKGLECEYYKEHLNDIKEYKDKVDYLILGEHFIHFDETNYYRFCYRRSDDDMARQYAYDVCEGLDSGLFTYLAHPDYFLFETKDVDDVFVETSKKILAKLEEKDIPVEINFGGLFQVNEYKQGKHFAYPNRLFWQIAKDYKIRCVIGFDAHGTESFKNKDKLIKQAASEIDDLGLNIITKPFIKRTK